MVTEGPAYTDAISPQNARKRYALATSFLTAAGAGESVTLQVTGVIGAVGACVAYMLAEGLADSSGDQDVDKTE